MQSTYTVTMTGHKFSNSTVYKMTVVGTEADTFNQVRNHARHMTGRCGFTSVEAVVTSEDGKCFFFADAENLCG